MNHEVFVTCAVTGAGDTVGKSDKVPVTPAEIAAAAIEAAKAGAAVAHIHVRDPGTGKAARDPALYREVVARVRESGTDVVLNLTAGMGGDLVLGGTERPLPLGPGTDMGSAADRVAHVEELLPEICTLDCGSMNFAAGGDYVMVNTPDMLRAMARRMQAAGVKPEIELFDTGHVVLMNQLIREGLIDTDPLLVQLCMGIPFGAPDDPLTLLAMRDRLPAGTVFSAFSIGRMQLPYVAMAALAGGNVRVGLEDNLFLAKGRLASNGELVERALTILSAMGARIVGPTELRQRLKLKKRW